MRRAHTQAVLGLIIEISNGNAGHADQGLRAAGGKASTSAEAFIAR